MALLALAHAVILCSIRKESDTLVMLLLGEKLYIVMELIEGVTLAEHLVSLKEKHQKFSEDRLWNIFIQVTMFKSFGN